MTETSFNYKYSTDLPSILLVDDDNPSARELRQRLEKRGCQVHQTNLNDTELAAARQKYFELIVLDLESLDKDGGEIYKRLSSEPELDDVPVVILTTRNLAEETIHRLERGCPVYYLSAKDASTVARLWQIIEQRHYMTYRYM
jgi:DNA-binding response OmpR family regulator